MIYIIIFVFELIILFLLSRKVQGYLGHFLFKIFNNKKIAIYIMAILFLPGTFIHEMSHFLFALFLLVPVGDMELVPKIENENIKLGSVAIAKTDPIRRFLVGIAPFFLGVVIILSVVYLLIHRSIGSWLVYISAGYIIFTISNTMFMSKKDMEGSWLFLVIVLFVVVLLWVFGVSINIDLNSNSLIIDLFKRACLFLLAPLALDIIAITLLRKL